MNTVKIKSGQPVRYKGKVGKFIHKDGNKYFQYFDKEGNPIIELLTNSDVIEVINTIFEALRVFEKIFNVRIPISLSVGEEKYGLVVKWVESNKLGSNERYFRCMVSYEKNGESIFAVIDDKEKKARKKMKSLLKEKNII